MLRAIVLRAHLEDELRRGGRTAVGVYAASSQLPFIAFEHERPSGGIRTPSSSGLIRLGCRCADHADHDCDRCPDSRKGSGVHASPQGALYSSLPRRKRKRDAVSVPGVPEHQAAQMIQLRKSSRTPSQTSLGFAELRLGRLRRPRPKRVSIRRSLSRRSPRSGRRRTTSICTFCDLSLPTRSQNPQPSSPRPAVPARSVARAPGIVPALLGP